MLLWREQNSETEEDRVTEIFPCPVSNKLSYLRESRDFRGAFGSLTNIPAMHD